MKKVVNSVKDIPDWFSLKNYEFTSSLNAAGWCAQLYPRYLQHGMARKSKLDEPISLSDLDKLIENLSHLEKEEFLKLINLETGEIKGSTMDLIVSNSGKLPM